MIELTLRQRQVLDFIVGHFKLTLCYPTYREIAKRHLLVSTNAVSDNMIALEKKGYIKRQGQGKRISFTTKTIMEYGLYWEESNADIKTYDN